MTRRLVAPPARRPIGSLDKYQGIEAAGLTSVHDEVDAAIAAAIDKWGDQINCFTLHLELKVQFPRAIMWGSGDHVMTEIDGMMFDVRGLRFTRMSFAEPRQIKKCFGRWPAVNS